MEGESSACDNARSGLVSNKLSVLESISIKLLCLVHLSFENCKAIKSPAILKLQAVMRMLCETNFKQLVFTVKSVMFKRKHFQ